MFRQRVRVPVLGYFAIVAPVLLGFLALAEVVMGPPPPMPASADAPVLFKKQVAADASVQVLTVPPPIPVPASEVTGSVPQITVTPSEAARPAARPVQETAKKKVAKPARPAEPRDRYAFDPLSRPFGLFR
ncbi:MAG: hypothetical protein AB1490_07785 [Pseudomonadota bacterium]